MSTKRPFEINRFSFSSECVCRPGEEDFFDRDELVRKLGVNPGHERDEAAFDYC